MKRARTATFLIEVPLAADSVGSSHLRAHLQAGRCLSNALLSEANTRLRKMRSDAQWQAACAIPRTHKHERSRACSRLRQQYQFAEYALHNYATGARVSWIADPMDATMAQTLASRASHAVNRVCLHKARRVRFRSHGRGLDSVEGKRNESGMRCVLPAAEAGNAGWLIWGQDRIRAISEWDDPVIHHGLLHPIKVVRLLRRAACSAQAQGADCTGHRYFVQLVLAGTAHQKPKHPAGTHIIGLDIGPSTLALVPREGEAHLLTFCAELTPKAGRNATERVWDFAPQACF